MNLAEIREKTVEVCYNVFRNLGYTKEVIAYANFIEDFSMDSLMFISLVVEIESSFSIVIPDELLLMENFERIDNILDIIVDEIVKRGKEL